MARLRQYLNFLNGWEQVDSAVEARAAELPQLELMRPKLQSLLEQARSLSVRLDAETATKQDTQKQLRKVLRQGQALVDFMRTGAREHYGPDSEALVAFGVQPFRGRPFRSRKRATPPEAASPEKPPVPTSTSTPEAAK